MKAYCVYDGYPTDGALLVFAESRSQAKSRAVSNCTWDWEYVNISARRLPEYDKYCDQVKGFVVDTNDDLPAGADPFYNDIEL